MEQFNRYCDMAGIRTSMHDPAFDTMKQIGMLEDLIDKQPDAVLIHPVDGKAVAPTVDKLAAANIPVFHLDVIIPSDGIVAYSRHYSTDMGRAAGRYALEMAEKLGKHLNVYIIYGLMSMEIAIERGDGFIDAVSERPDLVTAIKGPDCGWTHAPATDAIMTAFPANPEYNAVYEMGSMGKGVVEGLRAIDRLTEVGDPDHVIVIANDEEKAVCGMVEERWIDAVVTHSPHHEIDTAMKQMFTSVILGKPVGNIVTLSTTLTSEDAGTPRWGVTWGVLMADEVPWEEWPMLDLGMIEWPPK